MSRFLFPVRLFYQSQGILRLNSSLLTFLEATCCRGCFSDWQRLFGGKRGFQGRIWKNRKCIDVAGRKKALCRRQGSVLREYLELHQRWKEKVVGYIHEHEQHYPACLSELINTTWHMLLFTCKGIFVRINTICKLSWKNYKDVIKHDLINWCRIGMDFYSVKKKIWSNSVINILTAYHWLTFPLPARRVSSNQK